MTSEKTANPQKSNNSGALIFIVDDEPMLLELATVVLEPHGYRIQTFCDPSVALQAFTEANPRPALIITDYAMHQMNGMELIRECKRIQPTQKMLLVSGTVGEEIFLNSPVKPDRYLPKPYQANELVNVVHALIST